MKETDPSQTVLAGPCTLNEKNLGKESPIATSGLRFSTRASPVAKKVRVLIPEWESRMHPLHSSVSSSRVLTSLRHDDLAQPTLAALGWHEETSARPSGRVACAF